MIEVRPQSWFVIKYLRAVFENVHISIFIPFHSLNIWGKGFLKMYTFCTVIHCRQHKCWFCSPLTIPLTFQSTFFSQIALLVMMSWHYFSFVLSITVLHVFEETEIPKSGLEIVQIVWERRRKAVLSLCTERVRWSLSWNNWNAWDALPYHYLSGNVQATPRNLQALLDKYGGQISGKYGTAICKIVEKKRSECGVVHYHYPTRSNHTWYLPIFRHHP